MEHLPRVEPSELRVQLLHPRARAPARGRPGDAGLDLACLDAVCLEPGRRATVGTGVAVALPSGSAGLVVPRSGLADRHGVTLVNAPGLIDPNYRGEIRVVLLNTGRVRWEAEPGDRIAQLLLVPLITASVRAVGDLGPAPDERGGGGFGSSGR